MKTSISIMTFALAALAFAGCKKENNNNAPPRAATAAGSGAAAGKTMPKGHPTAGVTARAAGGIEGKILETMNAGGYSYLKLKTAKGEVWAAVQQATVKVGDEVAILRATAMSKFTSKTLKRTFDTIYFGRLGKPGAPPEVAGVHGKKKKMRVAAAHAGKFRKKLELTGITKADHTIAEVFAQAKALAGKKIAVRGKVTKVSGRIMGRTWVHLQDGSGSAADKTFDLTVTTNETVKSGDIVVFEGTVVADKDFGAGYAYKALLEKATLKK